MRTLGEVVLSVLDTDVKFQVVDENFPINEVGILGMPFLGSRNAILRFSNDEPDSLQIDNEHFLLSSSSFKLPPRSKCLIALPVRNPETSV